MMNNYMPLLDHLNGQTSRKTNLRNQIRRNRNESIINKQLKQVIKNNPQRKVQPQTASLVNFTKYLTPTPIFTNFSKKERRRENFPPHYKVIITLIYHSQRHYTVFVRNSDTKILYKTLANWTWSQVAQSSPTLCNPMDYSPPDSSVHGIFQARILEWVAISFSRDLPDPGIELESPALACGFFTTELPGKPLLTSELLNVEWLPVAPISPLDQQCCPGPNFTRSLPLITLTLKACRGWCLG